MMLCLCTSKIIFLLLLKEYFLEFETWKTGRILFQIPYQAIKQTATMSTTFISWEDLAYIEKHVRKIWFRSIFQISPFAATIIVVVLQFVSIISSTV